MKLALYRPVGIMREYLSGWLADGKRRAGLTFSSNREDAVLFDLRVTPDGQADFDPPLPKVEEWLRVEPVAVFSLEFPHALGK